MATKVHKTDGWIDRSNSLTESLASAAFFRSDAMEDSSGVILNFPTTAGSICPSMTLPSTTELNFFNTPTYLRPHRRARPTHETKNARDGMKEEGGRGLLVREGTGIGRNNKGANSSAMQAVQQLGREIIGQQRATRFPLRALTTPLRSPSPSRTYERNGGRACVPCRKGKNQTARRSIKQCDDFRASQHAAHHNMRQAHTEPPATVVVP